MKKHNALLVLSMVAVALGGVMEFLNIGDPYPAEPLYILGVAALIPSVLARVIRPARARWATFATWWIVISIVIIMIVPTAVGSYFHFFPSNKEDFTYLTGGILLLVSLVILGWDSRKK